MAFQLKGGKKPQMNNASSIKTNAAMYASKTSMYGKPMMDGGPGKGIPAPPKEKGYEYAVWNKKYGKAYRKQEADKFRAKTQKEIDERKAREAAKEKKEAPLGRTESGSPAGKASYKDPKTGKIVKTIFDSKGDYISAAQKEYERRGKTYDISEADKYEWVKTPGAKMYGKKKK